MNFNKVLLGGNLTRDPEMRAAGSSSVANFGLAINRKWKDASGAEKEEVVFVDCEAWGKTAELCSKYLTKGRAAFVEGRLKLDTWTDKNNGEKRSKTKVVVENVQFVGTKPEAKKESAANEELPTDDFPV